jgi:cytosine/uracil/thiamine/allantoin permease
MPCVPERTVLGSSAALYPVLMREVFGIAAWLSSSIFALAVGLRLLLYTVAGHWSETYGPVWVLRVGLGTRLLACVALVSLGYAPVRSQSTLALVGFAWIVLPWSLLSVSSTTHTAHWGYHTVLGLAVASLGLGLALACLMRFPP